VRRAGAAENDLDDHGGSGGGYEPQAKAAGERESGTGRHRRPSQQALSDEEPSALVQELDRRRTTGEAGSGTDRIERLRGRKHYRHESTTAIFRRARAVNDADEVAPAEAGSDPAGADSDADDALEPRDG
ncbi:MAG: hypothetical protein ACYTF0_09145, partial [Planctomycetota bacterium]